MGEETMMLGRCLPSSTVVAAVLCVSTGAAEGDGPRHLVMLGNSMQGCGIDFADLSKGIGRRVESRTSGGVMSAHKFAMLWHETRADPKPEAAIIVFRRDNITRPSVRVTGKYGEKLQKILTDPGLEGIVRQVAFPEEQSGGDSSGFEAAVARSFVPHMVRVARETGVRLVLVRCKSRRYAEAPEHQTQAMKDYTVQLTRYLQERGVYFLDYVDVPGIAPDCYANGDHLNDKGKRIWTALMVEDLKALLAGGRCPRERTDLGGKN